jgi:tricorn protease
MLKRVLLAAAATLALASNASALNELPRFPTLHGDSVVFVAGGNLWKVNRAGGTAVRLTSDPGQDLTPRFSPDGRWIAFTAGYQGNRDVYVIPAAGGTPRRLTHRSDLEFPPVTRHGPNNMVVTWTPDSKNVVFMSRAAAWNDWISRLFEVPVDGGLPELMPLDSAGAATFNADGSKIAYNRIFRDFRTWKRYQGGLAQQIFTYDFASKTLKQVTDWKGTNASPMWYGVKIYFLSDRDQNLRSNIWVLDTKTGETREITHFTDYDIDFPSLGDTGLTFQQGGKLWVLDLPSETLHEVPVDVPDDQARIQPHIVSVADKVREQDTAGQPDYALAPNGKRVAFSARGDIFTVPAEDGVTRNLTQTSGADEDHPVWSPDGTLIAYTTDSNGEQQVAVRPAQGGPERILTKVEGAFFYTPIFSRDGKKLAVSDAQHRLWLIDVTSGGATKVADDPVSEIHDQAFSPDGRYLTYSLRRTQDLSGIWVYDTQTGKAVSISDPMENDGGAVFTTDGKYLLFISQRHEITAAAENEFNFTGAKTYGLYLTTLSKATPSPFAPKSDEGAAEKKEEPKKDDAKKGPVATQIDFDGLMSRAIAVPIESSGVIAVDTHGDKIVYMSQGVQTLRGPLPGEKAALHVYDISKRKDGVITEGLDGFVLAADGEKVLVREGHAWKISDVEAGKGADAKAVSLSDMKAFVDPKAEWREMFDNAWRLERDIYFNPKMNGADWKAMHDRYAPLLPLLGTREDLNYLIGQLQGELGNSHTYVGGGDDMDPTTYTPTAYLGADFALDAASGRYRFAKIYAGDNTRKAYRGPLSEPGLDVHEGDYLLAVDGHELKAPTDPFALLVGAQKAITLTIASTPAGKSRDVVVRPISNELSVREKAWIDASRATVDRLSGGKVGYIYLSDMSALGMEQFIRQFYPQLNKQALIIDDRWNGGGFIDQVVLERLRRVLVGLDANRQGSPQKTPGQVLNGPMITLINHFSASDGDIFPYYFRKYGLGKLLGTRTWGGVRGIRGEWTLLDGGYITIPESAVYTLDSQWAIENHGVDPDYEVENEPGELLAGHDKQLETAVSLMLKAIESKAAGLPPQPAWLPAYPPEGNVPGPK